jgi:two-component system phosphate regulon response regulator PhoB
MSPETTILIVEDDAAIREMLVFSVREAGYGALAAANVTEAWRHIAQAVPDLMLLDWMLPDESGIELLRRIRRDDLTRRLPVIMVTARGDESDRVWGLDAGADDYLSKPFSPRELLARIQAVLRRTSPQDGDAVLETDCLRLDPVSYRVTAAGHPLNLAPTEFRLLHFLMQHPERVYSRGQLLDQVWGNNVVVEERTVDVHVRRLRLALEPYKLDLLIQTVRGAGYRFAKQLA